MNGALSVYPAPPYILEYLRYTHRGFATVNYRRVNSFEKRNLYSVLDDGQVVTFQGFFQKICRLATKHGDTVEIADERDTLPDINWQAVKDINWESIGSKGPRDYQYDPIVDFLVQAKDNSGIVCATGGWGKTIMQAVTYAAFDSKNTILAIPLKQVFNQTYEKFCKLFPHKHIGRVGDGCRDVSTDITITTFKSLPNCAVEKCEMLLVDEVQSTTGEKTLEMFMKIHPIRQFGYTATDENLFNNADKVIKGLFGERLIFIPYKEAQADGAVVPGVVYMVKTSTNIMINASSVEQKILKGIKKCKERNKLIGDICKKIPKGWQTIIFVDNIDDHLIPLHAEMPKDTKFIHRGSSKKKLGAYALTAKQQDAVADAFSNNENQFLLATDAFRAGVDIPNCRVVVQASGGSSEIELLQEAYRGSRILPDHLKEKFGVEDKTHFVLIDFIDVHDQTLENMSLKRIDIYKKQGWKVVTVDNINEIDWSADAIAAKTL